MVRSFSAVYNVPLQLATHRTLITKVCTIQHPGATWYGLPDLDHLSGSKPELETMGWLVDTYSEGIDKVERTR
jgi:hypothetical protein